MTQAFNLSQVANKIDSSGKLDGSTALNGTLPIANGGTNNSSLAVTAGGIAYTDGSKLVNTGAGTANQYLISNGSSAPTWQSKTPSPYVYLGTLIPTAGSTSATISGLTLTNYKWVFISFYGQAQMANAQTLNIGTSLTRPLNAQVYGMWGSVGLDLINGYGSHGLNNGGFTILPRFAHGYTTSSTSINLNVTTTGTAYAFTTAPIYFWGVL